MGKIKISVRSLIIGKMKVRTFIEKNIMKVRTFIMGKMRVRIKLLYVYIKIIF